jgi:hypothetical protein
MRCLASCYPSGVVDDQMGNAINAMKPDEVILKSEI